LLWNGFYVGLNLGGAFSANSGSQLVSAYSDPRFGFGATVPGQAALGPNLFFLPNGNTTNGAGGVIGGGQGGYNFQFNQFVIGVETDIQGTSLQGTAPGNAALYPTVYAPTANNFLAPLGALNASKLSLDYLGTVRGRAGYLFTPSLLLYGTAGFAYGGVSAWSHSNTRTGWTAGAGVEWMFMPNWSAKLEYLYTDLSSSGSTGAGGWNYGYHFHPEFHTIRAGVNYHFNWAAPAPAFAKY
jgi:outer membrane immunogenic protein